MIKICEKCNGPFEPSRSTVRFCNSCQLRKCDWCGKTFHDCYPNRSGPRTCSLICRSQKRFEGNRQIFACANCGLLVSKTRSNIRGAIYCGQACRTKGMWANPEMRARVTASLKASPSVKSPERIAQLDRIRQLKEWPTRDETRELIRVARMKQHFPIKMTSIEQRVHSWLMEEEILFEMHVCMFGRWQPDFTIRLHKLCIQADGDYWHSRPLAIENDRKFDWAAHKAGWKVLRLLGSRINEDPDGCRTDIREALGGAAGDLLARNV